MVHPNHCLLMSTHGKDGRGAICAGRRGEQEIWKVDSSSRQGWSLLLLLLVIVITVIIVTMAAELLLVPCPGPSTFLFFFIFCCVGSSLLPAGFL